MHCLKYGLTVHNILKIRAVSIEGDVLEIGGEGLDAAGYDLLALMTGSEGMLAVVTEVTVKLLPKPECAQVVMAAFDDVEKAGAAVANIIAAGIIPAGLEMMDQAATVAVEQFVHAGYPTDIAGMLLCESDGTVEEVADEVRRVEEIMERSGATLIRVSHSDAERLTFWAGRKAAFPAVGRISPDYYCMDGTIPRKRLAEVLRRIAELEVNTACAARTSSTPATATCIRSFSTTRTSRTSSRAPKPSAPRSSSSRSRSAARSRASTASASRR